MKKILHISLCILLMALLVLPVSAAVNVSVSASKTNVTAGEEVTFTVSIGGSVTATSIAVEPQFGSNFSFVSGQMTLGGSPMISTFYGTDGTGVYNTPTAISGTICKVTLKATAATAIPQSVSFRVVMNNGAESAGSGMGSANIRIFCASHSYSAWTEKDDNNHIRTCSVCFLLEEKSHSWDNGKVTTPATCKDEGVKNYTCSVCSGTKTETIAKTAHTYGTWAKADDTNHARSCSACSEKETAAHSWDQGTVTKPATCKEEGIKTFTCSVCKATKNEKIPTDQGHKYGAWTKVDDNTHKHTCTVCEKAETASHTWNNGMVTTPATCKEEGVKTYTCTACKATKTENLDKTTTHKYSAWEKVDDTTHERVCSVCDKKETGNHSYSTKWSKDKNQHWHECSVCKDKKDIAAHTPGPAATEQKAQSCTTCNYVIKPALAHKHNYADAWTTDENGHWYICSGCEEKGSYAVHEFENGCDTDCAVCGYTREISHSFVLKSDEISHWNECESCGLKEEIAAHIPGAEPTEETAQTCTVCGYEIAPALEPAPTEAKPDPTEIQADNGQPADFPWWIVIVAAAVILIAVTVVVIKKKK